MGNKKGIVILSHCGYSFIEALTEIATSLGLESYVLSSQPLPEKINRIADINKLVNYAEFSTQHSLTWTDIEKFMDKLTEKKKQIVACISVWENYRELMSKTNQYIGVNDLAVSKIEQLRDKFSLRKTLNKLHLSQINVDRLTEASLKKFREERVKKFIKPRYGLASMGAFSLSENTSWRDIVQLKRTIASDVEYSSVFHNSDDFIIEDFISGTEYCFEVISMKTIISILALHEKLSVISNNRTTLEPGCISPPISLSKKEIENAAQWLRKIFSDLKLDYGCFHVEARYFDKKWEIIEINPRVGGSLLNQSVTNFIDNESILSLWIKSLVTQIKDNEQIFLEKLMSNDINSEKYNKNNVITFFHVYFAEPGKKIADIKENFSYFHPIIKNIFLKSGSVTPNAEREIFLGQALWCLKGEEKNRLNDLIHSAKNAVEVIYEKNEF